MPLNDTIAYQDWLNGMKRADIAKKYEVKESAVKSRINRTWKAMRDGTATTKKVATPKQKGCNPKMQPATASLPEEVAEIDNSDLTEKQKEFCINYVFVKRFNGTQSYLNAFGGTYGAAAVSAYDLLRNPKIIEEITRLKEIRRQQLFLEPDDIVEMHMKIAFADMNDFVDFGIRQEPVMGMYGPIYVDSEEIDEEGKKKKKILMQEVNAVEFKESSVVDGSLICEVSEGRNGTKIKLLDKQRSLSFLEKFFTMNPMDKHKIEYDNKRLALEEKGVGSDKELIDDWIAALEDEENGQS